MYRRIVALCLASWVSTASAADYYLEGPASASKSDANGLHKVSEDAGISSRVVRRYVEGEGWRYVLVAEGYSDQSSADSAGKTLATAINAPVAVFELEGKDSRKVGQIAPAKSAPPVEAREEIDPEVAKLLARATDVLGGPNGGGDVIAAAKTVRFEYARTVAGGLEARHVYLRRNADQALEVRVVEGDGVDSETRLVGGTAWLRTGRDGSFSSQDAERAAELLEQASPIGMVPLVLVFADAAGARGEFDQLARSGTSLVEGDVCDVLTFAGDRTSGPMTLEISQATGQVRRISFEEGKLVHQFDDYATIAPRLVVPKKIRTWREGKLAETTEILSLQLDSPVADAALASPQRP